MFPKIWGESGWDFIHFITLGYPENPTEEDKEKYYKFFNCLKYVLPCLKCRYNMEQHLKKHPLTNDVLSSRDNLVKWGIEFHNIVNFYTGKPLLSYQEAIDSINKKIYAKIKQNSRILYCLLLIMIIILVVCFIYYLVKNKKLNI